MTIKEAMRRTGLSRKAIYVYEDKGLLKPLKSHSGYREYSEEDVERLLLIAKMRELELPLEDITQILRVPEGLDILVEGHFRNMQKRMQEMLQKISRLQTILYNLPPNGQLEDFIRAADIAVPMDEAVSQAKYLSEDIPASSSRRLAMQLFEAFLDLPLDTPERWNAWYDLLDKMERMGGALWDGYEEYYGRMNAEQRYEDYCLRRELVTGYTKYGQEDEKKKAEEILQRMKRLLTDGKARREWSRYYRQIVYPTVYFEPPLHAEDNFAVLSSIYHTYNAEFKKLLQQYIRPYLETDAGTALCRELKSALGDAYDISYEALIYFDFYNNTIDRMTTWKL